MGEHPDRRATIVVVDDEPDSLNFLLDTLDQAGMTVLVASDGQGALDLLQQITPDLVLMDAMMPVMNGFEACRQLKKDKRFEHLPVIFMTGLSETEHVVEGLSAGGVDYLAKPIVVEELLARIRVHLANARITHRSQAALDSSGRFLLSTDETGRMIWCTPRVDELLRELFPGWQGDQPPAAVEQRLSRLRRAGPQDPQSAPVEVGERRLEFTLISRMEPGEFLFRMTETQSGADAGLLQKRHGLTMREAEVLLWLSRGKPNREISEILGISPRTVNKHLEQVFQKLGTENRASAAVLAVRTLSQWG
ncbi:MULTISPECIES: response regulator transcription factor [unclassified Phenylobacterium]|uniref:response regulator transcription factor n=1 Tax=unclassified Phenylobacterium TaxID=2640670 RepID=UPI00083A28E6|nr:MULTISPECIES: response regulator transcription factor [unclassified Phenylobacterium]